MIVGGDDIENTRRNIGVLGHQFTENCRTPGGVRGWFENHGVTGGQRWSDLGEVDLMREIPGRNGTDDSDGFADDRALGCDPHRACDAEIGTPRIGLGRIGAETQILDRPLQLGHRGKHSRCPDLSHGDGAELFNILAHRVA